MKKFFLFAAVVAAMTVNAKVISFAGIIDKTDAETAKASCEAAYTLSNITVAGAANSSGTAYCAEITQTTGTDAWDVTTMVLKADDQVYFTFKDANDSKKVAKAWADYIQPNGKAMCAVITGLASDDIVKVTLKEKPAKQPVIEGAEALGQPQEIEGVGAVIELKATADEIRIYSKDADNSEVKWKLISVEVPGGDQAVENIFDGVKAEKRFENGQLVIIKNGVKYNALGAQL